MKEISTLIYFVSNFQADSENSERESLDLTLTRMEKSEVGPSERTIENIMNFARSYEVLESEEAGFVEMNLN
ncbi:hypothetical protein GM418_18130 [Maribellus comscasis]|uniref:Uncharacterized protein n=1 Tax=Maribellus comscasis TaxID=2681766 RepID=A0A6I6JWP8_9BACT|nr:hypothetical protein [Maribellus comscasis]QGY45518.1 hypothetical protein GM418_18130 [Maribellus comscasis]